MVFLANDKTIEQDTETLKAFLRASQKGFADMKNDPQGSLDLLLSKQSADEFPLSRTVEEQSMNVLLPAMETAEAPFLSQREEVWQTDIDWLLENKLIDNPVAVSDVMVELEYCFGNGNQVAYTSLADKRSRMNITKIALGMLVLSVTVISSAFAAPAKPSIMQTIRDEKRTIWI